MSRLQKLTILRGLPGSGKTTRAAELLRDNKFAVRVNKDTIREMLFMGDYKPQYDRIVVEYEYQSVDFLLSQGKDVIVDDTNLAQKHIDHYHQVAGKFGCVMEIVYVNTPIEECIRRDLTRKGNPKTYVGADNILNMAHQFKILEQEKSCVIFDMDGTLADCSHRQHFVRKPEGAGPEWHPDWDRFFAYCYSDTPRQEIVDRLMDEWGMDREIIICSGRSDRYRDETEEWLKSHKIPWGRLIMRRDFDYRDDVIVKQEMLDKYLDKTKIVRVYDDRKKVIDMWRRNGLEVVDCGGPDSDF